MANEGERIGIEELPELAATVKLGGEQGARMTSSLVAKASSMRAKQLAEIEADANAATERMGLPMVLLFMGFLILLGYPAMQTISAGERKMEQFKQLWQYYNIRLQASRETDRDRGEVSATTVVLAASLIALAISVGVIVSGKVRDKANDLNLG